MECLDWSTHLVHSNKDVLFSTVMHPLKVLSLCTVEVICTTLPTQMGHKQEHLTGLLQDRTQRVWLGWALGQRVAPDM